MGGPMHLKFWRSDRRVPNGKGSLHRRRAILPKRFDCGLLRRHLISFNRSNAYSLLEDYESVLSDLNEALRLDPSDKKQALVNRCRLYGRLGRWPEALADCNQSLILKDQEEQEADRNSETLIARGYVYLRMGNYKDAAADYAAALFDPHTNERHRAEALYGRGFARNRLEAGGGQEDLAAALRSRPEIAGYFSERGVQ
jgi:tetratricopeptide (TPR) repeat protein